MTISEFCNKHMITLNLTSVTSSPYMPVKDMNHYRARLRYDGREMEVPFSTGSGWKSDPTAKNVLACLQSDASSAHLTFEEWCGYCGFGTYSRRAEAIHKAVQRQTLDLRRMLGPLYDEFMECEED